MRVIHVLRKPPSEGTVAANVLKHGCGGLNIDASRVAHANPDDLEAHRKMVEATKARGGSMDNSWKNSSDLSGANDVPTGGRWPANVILQHLDGCRCDGVKRVPGTSLHGERTATRRSVAYSGAGGHQTVGNVNPVRGFSDKDGKETVPNWICVEGCPVAALDEQSGTTKSTGGRLANISTIYGGGTGLGQALSPEEVRGDPGFGDTGGASRFFKQVGGKVSK